MAAITVYLVGRVVKITAQGFIAWDLLGVYQNQAPAISACHRASDFYVAITTDASLTPDTAPIPGAIFPLQVAVGQVPA
jgi:hypothetical protein